MAGSRPMWKGQLRLSLVSINVEMFTAHKSGATTAFNQIHEPTGKRVHYQKVVDGVGPVSADDIRKGYEYEKGEYVLIDDDELDAVKLETKKTLDLVQFVDGDEIPPLYYDAAYYLAPADELAEDAFRVVRDAMRKAGKVGLGQLALRGKEYLVSIRPCGKGMLLETLHYEEEIKKSDAFFSEIPSKSADDDLLAVATALIDKKTDKFDPRIFKDHYQAALRELIARKLKSKGRKIEVDDEKPRKESGNVIDLMSALKKSLESGERTPAAKASGKPAKKAPTRKAAARPAPRKKAG
ncbi:MAG TPA: Ku protein [Devosia sp.]|nr:Ku protein [Devosia sp.]